MKFHKTSGKSAASPETTSSSPSKSPNTHSELATPHGIVHPKNSASPEAVPSNGSLLDQMLLHLPTTPVPEPFVNKSQLAIHYGVCERTIERWVAADMPRYYIGKREMRFRLSEVQLWLQQNHISRFAAHGIATTMAELQRRIINIPILNGLEILQQPTTARPSSKVAQGNALRPNPSGSAALKGQSNGQTPASNYAPRCKPGRKPSKASSTSPGDGSHHHKWKTSRYTRACAVCGVTEERDAHNQWITST